MHSKLVQASFPSWGALAKGKDAYPIVNIEVFRYNVASGETQAVRYDDILMSSVPLAKSSRDLLLKG